MCCGDKRGEPVVSDVDLAVEQGRQEECDVVIGLGGERRWMRRRRRRDC